ncbi:MULTISPECIES: AAA domain-containing protein [unclassified Pseudofrankia]|uniref:AAA domain-containing protein n=1 Tax=unclassified Pseudofrankia TaxID=2994372 RepID=UPI0008D974BB|nr:MULTISPECIES: AAA domain-containing protein [unclassified Pseudofrankia]MDT3440388.1 AAA family ATPase [Pseudofrankia sp. BMG5.37]OHV60825.1 helicase [Pseudofrankia sp. BMG5.36]
MLTVRPGPRDSPAALAARVTDAILADLRSRRHRGVVVDSPPGAGKSTLVVRAATEFALADEPLMIVAQTNEQVDDLVERLAADLADKAPEARVGRLGRAGYVPPPRIDGLPNVAVGSDLRTLGDPHLVVATAAKWAYVKDRAWRWAIVDEAYQMRSDALLAIARLFEQALFVGDPGQLDPFSTVDNDRWRGLTWDPMQSAVAVLLRSNPDLPVHRLPVSWRLPRSAERVVADAFYPFTGFQTGNGPGDRLLTFTGTSRPGAAGPGTARARPGGSGGTLGRAPAGAVDDVLDMAAATGWGLLELPARHTLRTDAEAVRAVADVARRLVARGAVARSLDRGGEEHPVTASRIAIGTAHRDQAAAVRAALGDDLPGVVVDTANRLQGREYDVTVVLHPLSGRRDATAFHLEAGRLCVLASRHRQACVVVARAGIRDLLDTHPSGEPVHLHEPVRFPDGWAANQTVLAHLERHAVRL